MILFYLKKKYKQINKENKKVFLEILEILKNIKEDLSAEDIQTKIYAIGKNNNFENLREYFRLIYQVLLGQEEGPRLGSFIKLFGIKKTIDLIEEVLKNEV